MRNVVATIAAPLIIIGSSPALSQAASQPPTTPATKPLTVCEGLARDWKSVEYELAENYAEGVADDSAPRATMRAVRDQNELLKAQMALSLLRDNKCALPRHTPSSLTYMLNAMKCQTEKLKGNYKSTECDHSTWTPIGQ